MTVSSPSRKGARTVPQQTEAQALNAGTPASGQSSAVVSHATPAKDARNVNNVKVPTVTEESLMSMDVSLQDAAEGGVEGSSGRALAAGEGELPNTDEEDELLNKVV